MRIAMIGTGYVGLVTGVCLAEYGYHVTCIDKDARKIALLNEGISPIYEPGLDELLAKNARAARLEFTTDLAAGVKDADLIFLAVGTPPQGNGLPDLSFLDAALAPIAAQARHGATVVVKSTVPAGTSRRVAQRLAELAPQKALGVVSNPEFLRQGAAIKDFMAPDRIVVGVATKQAAELMQRLYDPICLNGSPLFVTTYESSELIKYASNTLLATKVAFINEIADVCEKIGANVRDVARGVGMDKRIGGKFLQAGPGFGGSCFPKDSLALAAVAQGVDVPMRIVEAVIDSNQRRKELMVQKIKAALGGSLKGKTLAILGLTFKPGTDDMREAPSLVIVPGLLDEGATLRAYDPQGMNEAKKLLPAGIHYAQDAYEAAQDADAAVILTEWNEFRSLDVSRLKTALKQPLMIDLRNLYKRRQMQEVGFRYISVGRSEVVPEQRVILDINPLVGAA
jgi:UDPglucose 6-dehydrogenase